MTSDLIPFRIDAERVIELMSSQIYQSPLALLRENTQNAFDAIRERLYSDDKFEPRIDILVSSDTVTVSDNGVGMTPAQLQQHYWTAGHSSKNNQRARAAGVVGTFGIGAMANFGIADVLTVETESASTHERTLCRAEKFTLSHGIERTPRPATGSPGTTVTAHIQKGTHIEISRARNYILEFVSFVDIPIFFNGDLVSRRVFEDGVPKVPEAWRHAELAQKIGERLTADMTFILSNNADVWLRLTNLIWSAGQLCGCLVLRSGISTLRTFRNGFGLATASVSSVYQLGGLVDLLVLEPTAGREAITVDGLQLLQSMMIEIDAFTTKVLSSRDECDASTPFMNWVVAHNKYDLCDRMKMTVVPGAKMSLTEIKARSEVRPMLVYEGSDDSIVKLHATEDSPLLVLARSNPRRRCEQNYLAKFVKTQPVTDSPVVTERRTKELKQLTADELGLAFRIETILNGEYFLAAQVDFGKISHGLPVLAQRDGDRVRVTLNPDAPAVAIILGLYKTDFSAIPGMATDFVRNVIFPRIADYVPSSTRQGAEAFMKALRRAREFFEYADDDLGVLPKIWEDYNLGVITVEQAVERSRNAARESVQYVDTTAQASEVIRDVIQNEQVFQNAAVEKALDLEPSPAITRLETGTQAKLLTIERNEPALRGYRCFLAITDRVRTELGEFFLQPHRTSIVWGGQKTLFIFLHHSGQYGLYYDLQTRESIDAPAGGGPFPTATIVLKDRVFIPIPDEIQASFVPQPGERKRFEIRADIIRTEEAAEQR